MADDCEIFCCNCASDVEWERARNVFVSTALFVCNVAQLKRHETNGAPLNGPLKTQKLIVNSKKVPIGKVPSVPTGYHQLCIVYETLTPAFGGDSHAHVQFPAFDEIV